MPTTTRNDELREWPSILEGVDVWTKAKWPRRLNVTPGPLDLIAIQPDSKSEPESFARITYRLEEADGFLEKDRIVYGTLEHAGGGFARLTQHSKTYQVALKRIEPFVELSLSVEQIAELKARFASRPKLTVRIG